MYYAQRGEDRKIADYLTQQGRDLGKPGFYVDIGAWEPSLDSVTKHFYDRGWYGINVEPVPYYFEKLKAERPRDINLQCAISNRAGVAELAYFENSGLSTLDEEYKAAPYGFPRHILQVETKTLVQILAPEAAWEDRRPFLDIDFLKIDVEGHEREVLESNHWTWFRPLVLCIEATKPGTDTPAWGTWDDIPLRADYDFVEFDGLNRFYLRREKHEAPVDQTDAP